MNEIRNEDCRETIKYLAAKNQKVDLILTSPPYNNSRTVHSQRAIDNNECRYSEYEDSKTVEEYIDFVCELFNGFDSILNSDGVVLWNVSYGNDLQGKRDSAQIWLCIADIIKRTPFTVADHITWKKKNALPCNTSPNKLTRICESVFVFCRKSETKTFKTNKHVVSVSERGQKFYSNMFNYVEAKNNDGKQSLNKATFSVEFVEKLLDMYATGGGRLRPIWRNRNYSRGLQEKKFAVHCVRDFKRPMSVCS